MTFLSWMKQRLNVQCDSLVSESGQVGRRYDLDWLRVIVFLLLIFYHTGMLYVQNWGFHIKSQYLSESLESIMLLVNPWRMSILWLISGAAIRMALSRRDLMAFFTLRSVRLLVPLLLGILVIVPPQLYYEMTFNGDLSLTYFEFYQLFFQLEHPIFDQYQPGIFPHIDVNHLWYLRELWTFTIGLIVMLPVLNSTRFNGWMARLFKKHVVVLLVVMALPIALMQLLLSESKDAVGFYFLLVGFILINQPLFWTTIAKHWKTLLLGALVAYFSLILFYRHVWMNDAYDSNVYFQLAGVFIHTTDRVLWITAILGAGFHFLNHNSRYLKYFNEAVYPYYVMHQTIIIVIAFELSPFSLGGFFEPISVLIITILGCAISYEIIRRFSLLRFLFGLKVKRIESLLFRRLVTTICWIILIPFGLEILL